MMTKSIFGSIGGFVLRRPTDHRPAASRIGRTRAARASWQGIEPLEPRTFMDATLGVIVYMSPGAGGSYDIYVMNSDGTNNHDITNHTATDAYPQVSEDGTMVAFASDRAAPGTGKLDIYTMNIDGSDVRRITTDGASWDPAFNYDKSKILFTSTGPDGLYDIFTANADGTNRVNVTNSPGADDFASWNDEGDKIVFSSYRAVNGVSDEEIYIMNADGTNQTRLTYNPGRDTYASISSDGTRIAFMTDRDGNREVYVMNIDGGIL